MKKRKKKKKRKKTIERKKKKERKDRKKKKKEKKERKQHAEIWNCIPYLLCVLPWFANWSTKDGLVGYIFAEG